MGFFDIDRGMRPEPSRKIKNSKVNDALKQAQKELSMWESHAQALEKQTDKLEDACEKATVALEKPLRTPDSLEEEEEGELRDALDTLNELKRRLRDFR